MVKRFLIQYVLISYFSVNLAAQQLILPGDYPDPSVVKIGDTYWASATTSNWFPAFPLLKSKDLITWKLQGYVFNKLPEWADYYFWAPEITYENGKVFIYYAAHKKNGNLCVGIASADKPEGPYKDHGPLICQEAGSIDAFPMRDENGKLFLIWKEDANSVGKPTPIWAVEINEDRTALIGEKKELFRNTIPWEGNLVEGVSMIRHGDYFYAFYAGAGCCGAGCTYASGVARSKNLLGPWEKYEKNPVIMNSDKWTCPGHGTPIEKDGRFYFMYHGYDRTSNIFTGRQGLLSEYSFTPDGWIKFLNENESHNTISVRNSTDNFNGNSLSGSWQWSVCQNGDHRSRGGKLEISPASGNEFHIGQKVTSDSYNATAKVDSKHSTAAAGIGIIGDDKNYIAAFQDKESIKCVQLKDGKEETVLEVPVKQNRKIYLRVQVVDSKDVFFFYSYHGTKFAALNKTALDATYLPPWDRSVRVGVFSKGEKGQTTVYKKFKIANK